MNQPTTTTTPLEVGAFVRVNRHGHLGRVYRVHDACPEDERWLAAQRPHIPADQVGGQWVDVLCHGGGSVSAPAVDCTTVEPFDLANFHAGEHFDDAKASHRGLVITTDKRITLRDFRGLDDMQDAVGCPGQRCLIEPAVDVADACTMYVDEEGSYHGAPFNSIATDVAGLSGRPDLLLIGLRGDVVICGPLDEDGYDTDVTGAAALLVQRVAREAR